MISKGSLVWVPTDRGGNQLGRIVELHMNGYTVRLWWLGKRFYYCSEVDTVFAQATGRRR